MRSLLLWTGGHDFSCDDLMYAQTGLREVLFGLHERYSGVDPIAVMGCGYTDTGSSTTISPGYIWWKLPTESSPRLFRFPGYTLAVVGESNLTLRYNRNESGVVIMQDAAAGAKPTQIYEYFSLIANSSVVSGDVTFPATALKYGGERVGSIKAMVLTNGDLNDASKFTTTGLGRGEFSGWAKMNGENGTIDMRGKTIVGQGTATTGTVFANQSSGGEEEHQLTGEELPAHPHGILQLVTPSPNSARRFAFNDTDANNYGINFSGLTNIYGANEAHNNMQPYVALVYLQKVR